MINFLGLFCGVDDDDDKSVVVLLLLFVGDPAAVGVLFGFNNFVLGC